MNDILDLINNSNSILVMTHENPDGDAIGSSLAFYHALSDLGKDVHILLPERPKSYMFLTAINNSREKSDKEYDLGIIVDCANKDRIGQVNNEFDKCKKRIVIDHHASNTNFGDINYVEDNTSSCAQIIYYLFKKWKFNISKKMGECLITGVITDTGGFRNNDVDKNTFLMAADMLDLGVDINKIYYLAFSMKTMPQYLLMKMALDRLEMYEDGKIAFSYISQEDLENVGASSSDHEGLVDLGRNILGVEVSIFMREDNGYRISFRSTGKVKVNEIAAKFGGGGHRMAAGAKVNASFKETKEMLINETIKELNKQ